MGEQLFQRLKPVCVELIRAPTVPDLDALIRTVDGANEQDLQPLQQYILLPLRIILKGKPHRSTEVVRGAVRVIDVVFQHSAVDSWEVFSDFFVALTLLISRGPANADKAAGIPEELKLSATRCLTSMIKASTDEVLVKLFSLEFLPPLGHTVSILLTLVEEEQLRSLRLDAMLCLSSMMPDTDSSPELSALVRSRFCSFLPGISMSLCRVIRGDPKQGQNITKVAIATWTKAVTMIMSDTLPVDEESNIKAGTTPTVRDPSSLVIRRTADWLKNTAEKLNILIGQICQQKTNGSWQVRLALVNLAKELLLSCKSNLSGSVGPLLALLVGLLADDWPAVAKSCREALDEFRQRHMDSDDSKLVEILEENLHGTMTALPRLMRSTDDEHKLSTLNLVQGYLTLLGPKMNQLLRSSSHLHRLSMGLLQVIEFDVKDTLLLEEATQLHEAIDVPVTPTKPLYYNFKAFSDERILSVILNICHLLGLHGDLMLLIDHFLDLFRLSALHRKQASLVINHILKGTLQATSTEQYLCKSDIATLEAVIQMVLDEYLQASHWSIPTSSVGQSAAPSSAQGSLVLPQQEVISVTTLQDIQNNTLLSCLLLEGIADSAMVLGPAFSPHLMQCLYPLLEKLAADKAIVRQTALCTLNSMACSCGYGSIATLLSSNADYLVDDISSRLRHLDWYSQAPHVLKVTIEQSDSDILPLLEDTIEEILWSLDSHFLDQASSYVAVLSTIASAILRWFPPAEPSEDEILTGMEKLPAMLLDGEEELNNGSQVKRSKVTPIEEIQEFFLTHLRNKRLDEGDVRDEDLGAGEDDPTTMEGDEEDGMDQKKELPLHVQTIIKILERCQHHMATTDPRIRLGILSTVQTCVRALASHTEELLPTVHKIWPSLVPRFMDEEPLVVCEACTTLDTLSLCCGDFLRQRVSKEVLPKLVMTLTSLAHTSRRAGPAYAHTASHRLQSAILGLLGPLCERLDIGEIDLGNLSYACVQYLSGSQPVALQEACRKAFSSFIRLEPDAMWLLLNELHCPLSPIPPSEQFPAVKFKTNPRAREFETNVSLLLQELENPHEDGDSTVKSGEG